ncbi:MAG: glycosyltransferase, partial [Ruminococcus sp.]|nr:glycosyltransferase [Ruminococcus sp.]
IAPNKKQENIIKTFYFYKKTNPDSRLILVGSYAGMENYYERLETYVKALGLSDVIFTGHVKFSEILAYYRIADVFLCMSEHEGFCVPLTEAMFFNVPVIALNAGAVSGTLGGSGILLPDNDPVFASEMIEYTLNNSDFRRHITDGQKKRLADFSYKKTSRLFRTQLKKFINSR